MKKEKKIFFLSIGFPLRRSGCEITEWEVGDGARHEARNEKTYDELRQTRF